MARTGRELAIVHGPQLTRQRLLGDRDAKLLPDPLDQVDQTPAHHTVDGRNGPLLDDGLQGRAMRGSEFRGLAGRLAVDQARGPMGVELHHPVPHDLHRDPAEPGRRGAGRPVIDRGQGQKAPRLRAVLRRAGDRAQRMGIKVCPERNRHGEPPSFATLNQTCLKPTRPNRVTPSGTWYKNGTVRPEALAEALSRIMRRSKVSPDDLAQQLGIDTETLSSILIGITWTDTAPWLAIQDRLLQVLRYDRLEDSATGEPSSPPIGSHTLPMVPGAGEIAGDPDPFAGCADNVAADESREKAELFGWADSVLDLSESELELALEAAMKRFGRARGALCQIIRARPNDKKKQSDRSRRPPEADGTEEGVRCYGTDFKVSSRGVFARR